MPRSRPAKPRPRHRRIVARARAKAACPDPCQGCWNFASGPTQGVLRRSLEHEVQTVDSMLTTRGRLTIPKPIRDHLGLRPGDRVKFFVRPDGGLALLPVSALRRIVQADPVR